MLEDDQKRKGGAGNSPVFARDYDDKSSYNGAVREPTVNVDDEIDLRDLFFALLRRKWIILAIMLFLFSAVAWLTFSMTPQFKATGSLQMSSKSNSLISFDAFGIEGSGSSEFQQTQVELFKSDRLATRVIERLGLMNNKLFNPDVEEGKEKSISGKAEHSGLPERLSDYSAKNEQQRAAVDRAIEAFKNRFTVNPVKNSELVKVSFETPNPDLSAELVNTTMDEFINMHMDNNLQAAREASGLLDKQILSAQEKLEKSESALREFSRKEGVLSLDPKMNMVFKQMEELNDALAKATAKRIIAEASYKQAKSDGGESLSVVLANPLIQKLKGDYSTLKAKYEEMLTIFKPDYPKLVQLKAQMEDLSQMIRNEKAKVVDSLKSDYDSALKIEKKLKENADIQKEKALDLGEKSAQYKILEREVETNNFIYNALLKRSKEIEASVGSVAANMQIIDKARPPLAPYKPNVSRNLLLGIMLGLLAGITVAFIIDFFDDSVKSPEELSDKLHVPVLGLVPYDKSGEGNRGAMALNSFNDPRSPVAESVRAIMTSVRLSAVDVPPKSLLVTSVLPGAGKSSLSSNICLSCFADGKKAILIDADLRKPSLHNIFKKGEKGRGLSSVLSGIAKLSEVITETEYGIDFISSGPLPPNPADLLSSGGMRRLLKVLSERYDCIIVDSPPYQGFAELLALANMVDGVILIAVEGNTPREGVKHFRKSVLHVGGSVFGAIINKSGKKKGYSYSYGGYNYHEYKYGKEA